MTQTLTATAEGFERLGQKHLVISGALHYPRVHPDDWRHRLELLAAMGCNTVETYVPWNFHEAEPGKPDFNGWRDLGAFLDLAAEVGLDAIVRPGPYICAEWEAGGFPGWLLADPTMRLRVMDPAYLAAVDRWFDALIPVIAQRQANLGGNVVMVQVENEYGSFGDDTTYLEHLRDGLRARGITEMLVTSDGPDHAWLSGGMVDGAVPTVNFGSRASEVIAMCDREIPGQPKMCMEFWNGWFDHWGEEHHTRDAADAAAELDAMLGGGMSVNFYMAHGGTNFELWNGANHADGKLQPTVTSYDYDAAISEDGRPTEKFHAFREVIGKYRPLGDLALPEEQPRIGARALEWTSRASLVDTELWQRPVIAEAPHPPTFEALGLHGGMLHLSRELLLLDHETPLRFVDLRDRAHVFLDGVHVGTATPMLDSTEVKLPAGRRTARLDVLVESLGRVNFGPRLGEGKGVRGIWFGMRFLNGWQVRTLPLDQLGSEVDAAAASGQGSGLPLVATCELDLDETGVGYVDTTGLGTGYCWVNGFLVGRYWSIGPTRTLHVPRGLWRQGRNTITVLELEQPEPVISLTDQLHL